MFTFCAMFDLLEWSNLTRVLNSCVSLNQKRLTLALSFASNSNLLWKWTVWGCSSIWLMCLLKWWTRCWTCPKPPSSSVTPPLTASVHTKGTFLMTFSIKWWVSVCAVYWTRAGGGRLFMLTQKFLWSYFIVTEQNRNMNAARLFSCFEVEHLRRCALNTFLPLRVWAAVFLVTPVLPPCCQISILPQMTSEVDHLGAHQRSSLLIFVVSLDCMCHII